MSHPFPFLAGKMSVPFLKQHVVGLAKDFWTDGPDNLLSFRLPAALFKRHASAQGQASTGSEKKTAVAPSWKKNIELWHAAPGEISEKMWGEGFVTPGDDVLNNQMITPLGLNKEMNVLDLSAGLGGRMRRIVEETGAYITGLEPDAAIAERGMQMSIMAGKKKHATVSAYDPANVVLDHSYDAVIARETFYRVADRPTFFAVLSAHAKPGAQLAFTDYILDPEHREHPAVLAWKNKETLADPVGLVEMAELWAKVGFGMRVHEDMTDFYKTAVVKGLKRFMRFLDSGVTPDKETALAIRRRIEIWQYRFAALEGGVKFYRFYAAKR